MIDLRTKNEYPDANSIGDYLKGYAERLTQALSEVPPERLESALALLQKTRKAEGRIYVAGNGGSCSIAGHLCCDWMKGTHNDHEPPMRVHSLSDATALMTALANDMSYEQSISEQVKYLGKPGDLIVLISSSGNSPNIVAAAQMAKERGMKVIGLSGFKGGKLSEMADVSLHVPASNYGIAEDAHQALMHVLAQFMYLSSSK